MTFLPGRGAAALVASACAASAGPPAASGPISLRSHDCHRFPNGGGTCAYVYTVAGDASWTVYWANQTVAATATPGTCTTEFAEALSWGTSGRPGPAPAVTYPAPGAARAATPGSTARLVVPARGKPALRQRTSWPPGSIRAVAARGQLIGLWEGRTGGVVPFTLAAAIRKPGDEFGGGSFGHYEVTAPCPRVLPLGPGYLARAVSAPRAAWLQVRVPGFRPVLDRKSSLVSWAGYGEVTFAVSRADGTVVGTRQTLKVGGRNSIMLTYPPGGYVAAVTLRGPGGSRSYRLPFRIT